MSITVIPSESSSATTVTNISSPTTAFGELLVGQLNPVVQLSFEYTVDNTQLTDKLETNGGTVTQADGMGVVSTSTTTGSEARLRSHRHVKYRPGLGGLMRGTALFSTPVTGTVQHIGIVDADGSTATFENGYTIGYEGTVFGVHRFQNDSITTVALADCDDPLDGTGESGMTLDPTKLNVYQIRYQYLGAGAIEFWVESDTTGDLCKFHTIHYTNNNTQPSVHNPNFFVTIEVNNKATTSDMLMKTSSLAYFTEGKDPNLVGAEPQHSSERQIKSSVTSEVSIFTLRNKSTYASKTNYIDILVKHFTAAIEASASNNLGEVRLVRNATLGGTPSYSDINTTDSVIEIDTAGTTVTGGEEVLPFDLAGKNDRVFENLIALNIILMPGETLTFAGLSANSATIQGALLWKELF